MTESTERQFCFSTATCLELVDKLIVPQLDRELLLFGATDDDLQLCKQSKQKMLRAHILDSHKCASTLIETTDKLISLTQSFSRSSTDAMTGLQNTVSEAQSLVQSLSDHSAQPPTQPTTTLHEIPAPPTPTPVQTVEQPFSKLETGDQLKRFDLKRLDSELTYDKVFSNRKVAYFGDAPYKYSGGYHRAKQLAPETYLAEILEAVDEVCRTNNIDYKDFNSCMITKYESHVSYIPPHSDDESCIVPDSTILTISLGGKRDVVFRRRPPGEYREETVTVQHGDCYTMTRKSQDLFDHAVPPQTQADFEGPRISLTFRQLSSAHSRKPSTSNLPPHKVNQTKRVLILSDSKNCNFDCSQFRSPVIAFRKNLFFLRDLKEHRESIQQADIVLISAGINDIQKNRKSAVQLHNHIRCFIEQFPRTVFLFDAVSPLSIHADRFNTYNDIIQYLNELMFKCSLHHDNFRLFDNTSFSLAHLARDGLHLNHIGQSVLSDCWINCVLIGLGFRRGPLPVREHFKRMISYPNPGHFGT